jgi:DNA-directed RNA polymerase subunit RPC12/RpoP
MQAIAIAEKHADLMSKVESLQAECAKLKEWDVEAKEYETKQIAHGIFAYVRVGAQGAIQDLEKLCATCFGNKKKSLLQQSKEDHRRKGLACHSCGAKVVFDAYIDQYA